MAKGRPAPDPRGGAPIQPRAAPGERRKRPGHDVAAQPSTSRSGRPHAAGLQITARLHHNAAAPTAIAAILLEKLPKTASNPGLAPPFASTCDDLASSGCARPTVNIR